MKGSMCRVNVKALVIGVNPAWDERTKMLIISGITTDSDRMPHYVWASWTLPISDFHTLSVLPFARVGNFLELTSASCSFDQTDNPEVVNVRLDEPEFSEVDPMTLDKRDLESLRNFTGRSSGLPRGSRYCSRARPTRRARCWVTPAHRRRSV